MAAGRQKRKEGAKTVVASGPMTVATANKMKAVLVEALGSADAVTVSLENIAGVDVAFLQLLCSAHRTAAEGGKTLTVTGTDREPVASLLRQAGFLRHIGCHESTRRSCLWIDTEPGRGSSGR
jgi:ABC-type transporter Mla MlaB component